MPSPFPGMNPYLERPGVWHDFHKSFIPMARSLLSPQVVPRYFVRIEEHAYVQVEIERESFLEIRNREGRQVVCVIELLSPTNKNAGGDRGQYLAKRWQYLSTPVHFVEIDLLRGGPRMPMEDCPECDYYALVSSVGERPRAAFWPLMLSDRLPAIPIPLAGNDPPIHLDIQDALDRVYDQASYQYYIYRTSPEPVLTPEQQEWAKAFLPQNSSP